MTTVARTTSSTIVSILGTLNSAANMAAKSIDSAAASVDMLDSFVQRAKANQAKQHKIDDDTWLTNLIQDSAKEAEKREEEIQRLYANDPVRQQRFNNHVLRLEALFAQPTA